MTPTGWETCPTSDSAVSRRREPMHGASRRSGRRLRTKPESVRFATTRLWSTFAVTVAARRRRQVARTSDLGAYRAPLRRQPGDDDQIRSSRFASGSQCQIEAIRKGLFYNCRLDATRQCFKGICGLRPPHNARFDSLKPNFLKKATIFHLSRIIIDGVFRLRTLYDREYQSVVLAWGDLKDDETNPNSRI